MSEKKWTVEKVRQELYDARTKLFVIAKVLETGSVNLSEHPEWMVVMQPLLKEVVEYAGQIKGMCEPRPAPSSEKDE